MIWLLCLVTAVLGFWLGRRTARAEAAQERTELYRQWLAVSAKQADAMRCPGRALAALRDWLRLRRAAATPVDLRERALEIEAGAEPTEKELVTLLRSLADAAERPRA